MEEALKRGRGALTLGADMVLIHFKSKVPDEILEFASLWDRETPLVAVPTTYNTISAPELAEHGYKAVIFANHGMRAAIKNTQHTLSKLRESQRLSTIEEDIVPMKEVYRLMGVDDLQANEKEYLPTNLQNVTAVIAAADRALRAPDAADRRPSQVDARGQGQDDPAASDRLAQLVRRPQDLVVRGYKRDGRPAGASYIDNDRYNETTALGSFLCAEDVLKGRTLLLYGDIIFDRSILESCRSEADVTIVVDHARTRAHANMNGSGRSFPR
jgi:phosphoenolpyruvate phosphomutase